MSKSKVKTKLVGKHYSPLVIRKFTRWGFPVYVALITDNDLSTLDEVVWHFMEDKKTDFWVDNLQKVRDLAGMLTDHLLEQYERTEGAAVIIMADKTFISSLHGDFMNHAMCRQELYFLLNMSTGV